MTLDQDERLRLDYGATTDLLRTLTDVRFKLLAFVPTIAGAAVGFFGRPRPAAELLAVGLIGLVATLGVLLYELRNSQVYDYAVERAQELEGGLGLSTPLRGSEPGGLFRERPPRTVRLFGLFPLGLDRGLSLVYGAAVAGWSYLVAWGLLRALDVGSARAIGIVLGGAAGALVLGEIERVLRA